MTLPHRLITLAIAVACAACAGPQPFLTRNDHRVYAFPDGRFEVLARPGTSGRAYFCAAGDYAQRRLNARNSDSVVLVEPNGSSRAIDGGRSAVFEVRPQAEATREVAVLVRMNRAGDSLAVAHARALCGDSRNNDFSVF